MASMTVRKGLLEFLMVAHGDTKTHSCQAVFNTTELLETILISPTLPIETQVLARQINKQSRDTIDKSPRLLTKLFLRKDERPRILAKRHSWSSEDKPLSDDAKVHMYSEVLLKNVIGLHPLRFRFYFGPGSPHLLWLRTQLDPFAEAYLSGKALDPQALCRRMLLCQPPLTKIKPCISGDVMGRAGSCDSLGEITTTVVNEGTTFGDVLVAIEMYQKKVNRVSVTHYRLCLEDNAIAVREADCEIVGLKQEEPRWGTDELVATVVKEWQPDVLFAPMD